MVTDEKGFGKTIPLHGDLLRIGRDPSNGLSLDHPGVAPCHLLVIRQGLQYFLADTSSGLGVYVNGNLTLKAELHHGDVISLGPECPYRVTFLTEGTRVNDRERTNLRTLLAASRAINSSLVLDEVLDRVMDAVMEVTRAQKGFLTLVEPNGSLKARVARNVDLASLDEKVIPASRSVIKQVLDTRRSVVVAGGPATSGARSASIVRLNLMTVMCVPILSRDQVSGVIYVDHHLRVQNVTKIDLEVLESLADHASVAIENARLTERMLLAERVSAVGRMVSSIIHDFRGPLTSIRAAAELMGRDPQGPKTARMTGMILGEVDRMTEMTQDVLEFCRGRTNIVSSRQGLAAFLSEAVDQIRDDMTSRSISVVLDVAEDVPVLIDERRMIRVVRNLFDNAADAMTSGGVLTIRTAREEGLICLSVADTGCGMTEEVRRRVFEPFFSDGKREGNGLGMAIARRIVEAHDGEIRVESAPGAGTTVRIVLPLEAARACVEAAPVAAGAALG